MGSSNSKTKKKEKSSLSSQGPKNVDLSIPESFKKSPPVKTNKIKLEIQYNIRANRQDAMNFREICPIEIDFEKRNDPIEIERVLRECVVESFSQTGMKAEMIDSVKNVQEWIDFKTPIQVLWSGQKNSPAPNNNNNKNISIAFLIMTGDEGGNQPLMITDQPANTTIWNGITLVRSFPYFTLLKEHFKKGNDFFLIRDQTEDRYPGRNEFYQENHIYEVYFKLPIYIFGNGGKISYIPMPFFFQNVFGDECETIILQCWSQIFKL